MVLPMVQSDFRVKLAHKFKLIPFRLCRARLDRIEDTVHKTGQILFYDCHISNIERNALTKASG